MQKLKLDALDVETFEATAQAVDPLRGTVQGHDVSAKATSCCPYQTYVVACPVSTGCP